MIYRMCSCFCCCGRGRGCLWIILSILLLLSLMPRGASVAFVDCDPSISFPRLCSDRMDRIYRMSLLLLTRAWVPLDHLVRPVAPALLSRGAAVSFVDSDPSISFPRLCFDRMNRIYRMSLLLLTRAWVPLDHLVRPVAPVLWPLGASVAFVDSDPSISFPRLCFDRMNRIYRMSLLLLTRAWVPFG